MTLDDEFGTDRLELLCGTERLIVGDQPTWRRVLIGIATKSSHGNTVLPYATSHSYEAAARLRDYLDEILKDKT